MDNGIGERIKQIRNKVTLNQEEFAQKLHLSRSHIAQVETNKKILSDRTIKDICDKFNVNEQWLRTGEGDMFTPLTKNQEIANFLNDVMESKGEFKNDFILALSKLDDKKWEAIADFVNEIKK